ncbi:hypothetical protein Tco_0190037 [Tanacetum coccineum]
MFRQISHRKIASSMEVGTSYDSNSSFDAIFKESVNEVKGDCRVARVVKHWIMPRTMLANTLSSSDIGYQWRPTGKKFTLGKLACGYQWRPTGKKFALGEMCPLTKLSVKCSTISANQQVILWYLDSGCSKHMTGNRSKLMNFVEKFIGTVRFGNDHFGAIMGYGDYVIGDSVISRVYYVEGLRHNLFSVGQFCDSDLEVAFRKHTCFVRDINGADILKGSHRLGCKRDIVREGIILKESLCIQWNALRTSETFIVQCHNQEYDHLNWTATDFPDWRSSEEVFVSQPEGLRQEKPICALFEEGSSWAKACTRAWVLLVIEDNAMSLISLCRCGNHRMSRYLEDVRRNVLSLLGDRLNTMAEQNVPNQPPTRTDEQIVPRSQWLIIGKSNLLFNAQKIQKNPIFQISVDILSNTNFFQAFTASASVPAIYLQQFWNTMKYNEKTGVYSCQVDEQWFDLSVDLLRKALAITPVNPTHPFVLPPSGNTVIDFVNELGYPEPVEIVSNIRVNYVYQPWRAILTLINQAVMGRVYSRDPDIFLTQGESQSQSKGPKEESNSSPHSLWMGFKGNLKFVPKGETVEVFRMAILDPMITEAIQQSSYYPKYLEMVAMNTKKTPQESASEQPATKRTPPKKPTTTTPVKPSKPAPTPTKKPSKHKLPHKVRKGKPTLQLVDEEYEAQQESVPQREGDDPDLELAKKMSLVAHQEKGKGEGDDADMERAIKLSLDPAFLPQGRAHVGGVTIRDPVSETTPKLP